MKYIVLLMMIVVFNCGPNFYTQSNFNKALSICKKEFPNSNFVGAKYWFITSQTIRIECIGKIMPSEFVNVSTKEFENGGKIEK